MICITYYTLWRSSVKRLRRLWRQIILRQTISAGHGIFRKSFFDTKKDLTEILSGTFIGADLQFYAEVFTYFPALFLFLFACYRINDRHADVRHIVPAVFCKSKHGLKGLFSEFRTDKFLIFLCSCRI